MEQLRGYRAGAGRPAGIPIRRSPLGLALAAVLALTVGASAPSLASIANVRQVFAAEGRPLEPASERRIRSVATTLLEYIHGAVCPRMTLEAMARGEGAATP